MKAQEIIMIQIYTDYTKDMMLKEDLPEEFEKSRTKKHIIDDLIEVSKRSNHDILKHFGRKKTNFNDNLHELGIIIDSQLKIWNQKKN